MKRVGASLVVGLTAGLLLGLVTSSLIADLPARASGPFASMSLSLSALVGIGAAGAFWLSASGKRTPGLVMFGGLGLVSVAFTAWIASRVPPRPLLVLAASDRAELREFHDDDVWGIEHPTLGFRLPHPALALEPSRAIEEETRTVMGPGWADTHETWPYETADHGVSVMIDLSRVERADRASLDGLAEAVIAPLEVAGHAVTRHASTGVDGCLREPFEARLDHGGRVDAVLFTLDDHGRAFRLVVTVVSDGTGDWARWIEEVSLACERVRGGDSR